MHHALEPNASGSLDAASAANIFKTYLKQGHGVDRVYSTLATWLWHAVTERRLDDELRSWHTLILDMAFKAKKEERSDIYCKLETLADLLRLSIQMEHRPDHADVMKRAHATEILREISAGSTSQQGVARECLRTRLGLQTANLSRLLTIMVHAGFVSREQIGKEAYFRLTREGQAALERHSRNGRHVRSIEIHDSSQHLAASHHSRMVSIGKRTETTTRIALKTEPHDPLPAPRDRIRLLDTDYSANGSKIRPTTRVEA